MQEDRTAEVVEVCTSAILLMPQMPSYRLFRAEAYKSVGDFELALRDIDAALSLFPDNEEYQAVRQKILDAQNKAASEPP